MNEISLEEFNEIYNSSTSLEIIDIREKEQLEQTDYKIIPKSKHIPYSKLTNSLDDIDYSKDYIFIICRHGNSSIKSYSAN
jgi:rhodanese-related sulfurtransferase